MSDHADIVREFIQHAAEIHSGSDDALAALDALVAERDEAIEKHRLLLYDFGAYQVEAKAKQE